MQYKNAMHLIKIYVLAIQKLNSSELTSTPFPDSIVTE